MILGLLQYSREVAYRGSKLDGEVFLCTTDRVVAGGFRRDPDSETVTEFTDVSKQRQHNYMADHTQLILGSAGSGRCHFLWPFQTDPMADHTQLILGSAGSGRCHFLWPFQTDPMDAKGNQPGWQVTQARHLEDEAQGERKVERLGRESMISRAMRFLVGTGSATQLASTLLFTHPFD